MQFEFPHSASGSAPKITAPEDWRELYLDVLRVEDSGELGARITRARDAIQRRLQTLRPGFACDATEYRKLEDALADLRTLAK